jgi:hypothetical protein
LFLSKIYFCVLMMWFYSLLCILCQVHAFSIVYLFEFNQSLFWLFQNLKSFVHTSPSWCIFYCTRIVMCMPFPVWSKSSLAISKYVTVRMFLITWAYHRMCLFASLHLAVCGTSLAKPLLGGHLSIEDARNSVPYWSFL